MQQLNISDKAKKYQATMWQVTPYNRSDKRLSQDKYLDKLMKRAIKAELTPIGALIYCREMCVKHGYPTAF